MKGCFSHLCVSICLRDVPLCKQSAAQQDLQLLWMRNASSDVSTSVIKGSFRSVFSCFLCFSSNIFSMMVCSKELSTPLCWGWKRAIFVRWGALAAWLSWSDRRFPEQSDQTKLSWDTWPANRPESPPRWWAPHAKLPAPISGPANAKRQKKRRNPLWQPLSREHWQEEWSLERAWGIQLSHSQNVQIYNQSWGTTLTFAWQSLLL